MIFRSTKFRAQWDTWLYFHKGVHYLYYLITEYSGGEGIGLATSANGVHYEDHGRIIEASSEMVVYLGSGSVWKDPAFEDNGRFLINYSEWREDNSGRPTQSILFAESLDLVHWDKLGDERMFSIDSQLYEAYGRWDCINTWPRDKGGYWGSWTATPAGSENLNGGIGIGHSDNGLDWTALKPPDVEPEGHESGDFARIGDTWYALFGRNGGMAVYTAKSPVGPYLEQKKNSQVLLPSHSYFARFHSFGDQLLVNHHVMNGLKCDDPRGERPITFAAPLKKAVVDEHGMMRLGYWGGNEALKGRSVPIEQQSTSGKSETATEPVFVTAPVDFQRGVVVEGSIDLDADGMLFAEIDGQGYGIVADRCGTVSFREFSVSENDFREMNRTDREREFPRRCRFRFLARCGMAEFYLDDELAECWNMGCALARELRPGYRGAGVHVSQVYQMSLQEDKPEV